MGKYTSTAAPNRKLEQEESNISISLWTWLCIVCVAGRQTLSPTPGWKTILTHIQMLDHDVGILCLLSCVRQTFACELVCFASSQVRELTQRGQSLNAKRLFRTAVVRGGEGGRDKRLTTSVTL